MSADVQPGPCCICGATNYALSMGGPTICPKCDCGHFDAATVTQQAKVIAQLREELAALRSRPAPLGEEDALALFIINHRRIQFGLDKIDWSDVMRCASNESLRRDRDLARAILSRLPQPAPHPNWIQADGETVREWRPTDQPAPVPEWQPIETRPSWDHQPCRQFIRLEGSRSHHGSNWARVYCGEAFIRKPGGDDELLQYRKDDILRLCRDGDIDVETAQVTHWMPATFPAIPANNATSVED